MEKLFPIMVIMVTNVLHDIQYKKTKKATSSRVAFLFIER